MKDPDLRIETPLQFGSGGQLQPPPIPDHQLLQRIGRGSYGEVWLARSLTGAYRAVKIVYRQAFDHDRPFDREFSGIEKFEPISRKHESQVDILHVGRGEGCFYYVMELADDQESGQQINPECYAPKTLKSEVFHRGKLPFEECVQISLALTTALEHLHSHGLVHRDIKPSNIIFINGVPKLADIGLVTGVDATRSHVGTEGFVPPEGPGTAQADLYSLGKVLYEICTGKDRQEFPELPTDLAERPDREGLLELNSVIAKACREDPRQRYLSAQAMHNELLLLQSGKSLARLHAIERRLAKLKRVAVAGAAAAAITVAALLWQSHEAAQMKALATSNLQLATSSLQHAEESNQRLTQLQVANGRRLMEQGDYYDALLWFAQALTRIQGDPVLEEIHRIRFNSVLQRCPKVVQIFTHDDLVCFCEFSPDGERLVSASYDGTARVWSLQTGEPVAAPMRHSNHVYTASFSADGRRVVTASMDGTARVWDAATGAPTTPPLQHLESVRSASFDRAGSRVLTASLDGTARVWDAATGRPITPPLRHSNAVEFAVFSPDGKRVATGSRDQTARIWDSTTGDPLTPPLQHGGSVGSLAFSPDGRHLVSSGGREGGTHAAMLWDALTGQLILDPLPHDDAVLCVAFSPDGRRLITGCAQGARLWDAATGDPLTPNLKHKTCVTQTQFSQDGDRFITSSDELTARVWDANSGEPITPFLRHAGYVLHSTFSPDGRFLATASDDHTLKVWDLATVHEEASALEHPAAVSSASFSPDGKRVLTACFDGVARLWDVDNGKALSIRFEHGEALRIAQFSPDGKKILTASAWQREIGEVQADWGTTARLWDADSGKQLTPGLKHEARIFHAAFNPNSTRVVTASADRSARVWNAVTGEPITGPLRHASEVWDAEFSPDGHLVATASADGTAQVWDAATGHPISLPMRHQREVNACAFSPDGRRLLTVSSDQTGRVWDAHTGQPMASPFKHRGILYLAGWSPDGHRVIAGGLAPDVGVWDAATGQLALPYLAHGLKTLQSISFSPDGRFIATASDFLRVWSARTGEPAAAHLLHHAMVIDANFSPDSRRLVTAGTDGLARVWELGECDVRKEDLVPLAEAMAGMTLGQGDTFVPLPPEKLGVVWRSLRSKYPALFGVTPEQHRAWRERELRKSIQTKQWFAALFHLDHLAALDPQDRSLSERRTNILAHHTPVREPGARPALVDLSQYYNAEFTETWEPGVEGHDLAELPTGIQSFNGVDFDVRAAIRLSAGEGLWQAPDHFPPRVSNIRVNQRCQRLHFLHASEGRHDLSGTRIGGYILHYANGQQWEVPIVYGEDLRDWFWHPDGDDGTAHAEVAWRGESKSSRQAALWLRLFKRSLENPWPEVEITSIDFISSSVEASPFLVAITIE
jgi:WD40 repeat protein